MRKLKLQIQMSVDGFIAGTNGEMDWAKMNWSDDLNEYVIRLTEPVDTILLGRKLAEGFIPYWTAAFNQETPEPGSEIMVKTPKVVFSKTLKESKWENTVIATGDLIQEVNALKKKEGKDLIVYGGSGFVSSLIKEKLIDELHLFINPVIIGKGMPIFREIPSKQDFCLLQSSAFKCGIVVSTYKLS